jgi:type IV secretory pathway VirD2 relaxase
MVANVKMLRYLKHNGTNKPIHSAKEHIRYIEANREKHRNNPDLFNSKENVLDRRDFWKRIEDQPKHGVVLHKMVISLSEDEQKRLKIDMRELARDTMASFETKIGRRLDWVAAFHDDKGQPHVHVAFRGRDLDGKQIGIYPVHVKQLKQIAEQEKVRQAERNLTRSQFRDYKKELERERQQPRRYEQQRDYSDRSHAEPLNLQTSKLALNVLEQMIKDGQRQIERVQRKAYYEAEREAEQERNKSRGRGMER